MGRSPALHESGMEVMSWPVSGTTSVQMSKSWAVLSGHSYILTADITVEGAGSTDYIVKSASAECP